MLADAFRDCLVNLDIAGVRKLWKRIAPHLPQPKNDEEVLHTLHEARLRAKSIPARLKAYSLAWITERELDRAEPVVVAAVGAAVKSYDPGLKRAIEDAMSRAALSCIDEGLDLQDDADEVRRRMLDARAKIKAGRISV